MFINPAQILQELELKNNLIAADFGCGSGGFTIPLAKILKKGKVYAIDINKEALSSLLSTDNVSNIKAIHADIENDLDIKEMDLIIIANVLHQIENKERLIKKAKESLKNSGRVLIVDWESDLMKTAVNKQEILDIAKKLDLKLTKEMQAGKEHFALVFNK